MPRIETTDDGPRPRGFDSDEPDLEGLRCPRCNRHGMHRTGLEAVSLYGATSTVMRMEETRYGFAYGSAEVIRLASDATRGWVLLRLVTPKVALDIYASKTGTVRIHSRTGEWKAQTPVDNDAQQGRNS